MVNKYFQKDFYLSFLSQYLLDFPKLHCPKMTVHVLPVVFMWFAEIFESCLFFMLTLDVFRRQWRRVTVIFDTVDIVVAVFVVIERRHTSTYTHLLHDHDMLFAFEMKYISQARQNDGERQNVPKRITNTWNRKGKILLFVSGGPYDDEFVVLASLFIDDLDGLYLYIGG